MNVHYNGAIKDMKNNQALFIIFGATGDLAGRKLYPALFNLYQKGYLSENFAVIGTARREWTDSYFQTIVFDSVKDETGNQTLAEKFSRHFYYKSHNVYDTAHYHSLRQLAETLENHYQINGNRFFYLSMSPKLFSVITDHLQSEHLMSSQGSNRVIIEKPFGFDYQSSKDLNDEITKNFTPDQIYLIDHYLGKEMVQNITALRFSNPLFVKTWNKEFISNIQVTLSEDLGVFERGSYYDENGAIRDMVQNHVLQVISLLMMDPPNRLESKAIIEKKIQALESIAAVTKENVQELIVRGQYIARDTNEKSYRDEDKVDPNSKTETFVAGKIISNTEMLKDVPIYYRTGKQLAAKETRIDIVFKNTEETSYANQPLADNILSIEIDPNQRIVFQLNKKETGLENKLESFKLIEAQESLNQTKPAEAYESLLLDALLGEQRNFAQYREVAASWKYVDSIYAALKNKEDLTFYPIASTGPKEADALLASAGHYWIWKG